MTAQSPELTPGEPPVPIFTPFLPISGFCSPGCSLDGALGLLVPELSPHRLGWGGREPGSAPDSQGVFRKLSSTKTA